MGVMNCLHKIVDAKQRPNSKTISFLQVLPLVMDEISQHIAKCQNEMYHRIVVFIGKVSLSYNVNKHNVDDMKDLLKKMKIILDVIQVSHVAIQTCALLN